MPKSKKTAASATVTKSAINHATSILEELPEKPKENWSLREAVAHLQVQISSALSKGYSYEEVARMLTEKGIEISASSLKSYLSAAKRQKETATSKTEKTGRRSRKALSENLTVIAAAPTESSTPASTPTSTNGTAAKDSELNGAKPEPIASSSPEEIADSKTVGDAPAKRRGRAAKSSNNSSSKPAASKTAAKSKSTPRTKSTATQETSNQGTSNQRGKRKRQA